MRTIWRNLLLLAACMAGLAATAGSKADRFISQLMAKMTLEEKIGQLNLLTQNDFVTGDAKNANFEAELRKGRVGGVLNMVGAARIRRTQQAAVEDTRLGIPLLFGLDVIHGYRTIFPVPLAMSATWDMDMIRQCASTAAAEASSTGLNWVYSPMVDICRDARWGRIVEGAGEDPYLGSCVARAMIEGIQGDGTFSGNDKALACVKHFAIYGGAEAGLDYAAADMSRHTMYNFFFPPYKAALDAGAGSVMASFNDVEGLPATCNHWLMTDVLRKQWGFKGFVVSDYTGVSELVVHGVAPIDKVADISINAGVDMDMISETYIRTLSEKQKDVIDQACRRVLEAKYKLGLFDDPYKFCSEEREANNIYTEPNLQLAEKMAQESFVLLKNSDGVLPLKGTEKVALIGPMADSHGELLGSWCCMGDWRKTPSVREAMAERLDSSRLIYAKGCNVYYEDKFNRNANYPEIDNRPVEEMRAEALEAARQADVVMAVMGETANMSGEGRSRSDIGMPNAQRDLLRDLCQLGKPVVLVLCNGRPMSIAWEAQNVSSILDVWFGGSRAASAVVSTLYGDCNPCGKLTATFPQTVGQEPLYYNRKSTGRPLPEGKWFTRYRANYIDVSDAPLFPFGYGLSYTTYSYSPVTLSANSMAPDGSIQASVTVQNTGSRDGVETVQLYIHDMVSSSTRPVKELKDFRRVPLKAGESQTVTFTLTPEQLKYYDYNLNYVAESGDFEVMIGPNSRDVQTSKFTLQQ